MKNKKKSISILICLVLIALSLLIFVACDDNDNGEDFTDDYFLNIDGDEFESTIDSFIGYAMDFTSKTEHSYSIMQGCFMSEPNDEDNQDLGNGFLGHFLIANSVYNSNNEIANTLGIRLFFYDTEQHAEEAICSIIEYLARYELYFGTDTQFTIKQNGNMLIAETQQGLYDEIKTYTIPKEKRDSETVKFVFNTLRKEMREDNRIVELGEFNELYIADGNITNFGIYAWPKTGNYEKIYKIAKSSIYDDDFEWIIEMVDKDITADSYFETFTINGSNYVKYFVIIDYDEYDY